jgi:hypothetical protein
VTGAIEPVKLALDEMWVYSRLEVNLAAKV